MEIVKSQRELENNFLEIATALVGGTLTILAGTGFSMHLTDRNAPSWLTLLFECVKKLDNEDLIDVLFVVDEEESEVQKCKFDLTVCAQILEDEYKSQGKNIREEICAIVDEKINEETINEDIVNELKDFFKVHENINIVTTNYDTIFTDHIIPGKSRVYVEGENIPKIADVKNIYHIHGAVSSPESLILTQDDYFKFQHKETYISRKFYTLLQESTTVILGYSLGDFNLNRILNESKYSKQTTRKRNDIFYISRKKVDDVIKKYYFSTFGIQVIEGFEIDKFFQKLRTKVEAADRIVKGALIIPKLLEGTKIYKDEFLKLGNSFGIILARLVAAGYQLDDPKVMEFIIEILDRKQVFTTENNAWDQYTQLASWLIEFGSQIEIKNTKSESPYLTLVDYSFRTMSKELYFGYAWAAYQVWLGEWDRLTDGNKKLIIEMVDEKDHYTRINNVKGIIG